jgi:hypothetical protein
VPGEGLGVLRPEEVGPAGRAEQQRAAGEDAVHAPVGVLEHVGHVGERVPRRVQHADPQLSGGDHVAIANGTSRERHVVVGRDEVLGADPPGEGQSAGHVVVVDVRLGHVGDADVAGPVQDPVDVALRVDHHRHATVCDQIAAVP